MKKIDIVSFIKDNAFATWAAVLAIIPQTLHSFKAFASVEGSDAGYLEYGAAFITALALDLAVLVFTIRNREDIVIKSVVAMNVINVYVAWKIHPVLSPDFFIASALWSIVPFTMMYYANEIKGKRTSKSI